ncbi:MAG: multidrug ABC transporter [Eggerthella lenta]|jgi:multidrug transporter EmrE-like cation transporter|uniref:multidrug ABC transporter n=1 Tax=Eggerthella sp. TaxID=1929886 RepID=UPI002908A400|nr:multidrug ABC transporter [Eggerthella sp.]MDU5064268.1 multidrug ABC transporter [Eggerthella sp.]MDY3949219.1 multidrug ABC transporter [Eggerthella lenta]
MPPADMLPYIAIGALGVLVSSIAQVMLKKEALKPHSCFVREYLNPLVVGGYVLMLASTFMLVVSFRGIPLSMAPVLEAASYLYVTVFGVLVFKEEASRRKVIALAVIMLGIFVYAGGL